jgi:hypothetical protein
MVNYKICQLKKFSFVKKKKVIPFSWKRLLVTLTLTYNNKLQNIPIKENLFCTKKKVIPFWWKRFLVGILIQWSYMYIYADISFGYHITIFYSL